MYMVRVIDLADAVCSGTARASNSKLHPTTYYYVSAPLVLGARKASAQLGIEAALCGMLCAPWPVTGA